MSEGIGVNKTSAYVTIDILLYVILLYFVICHIHS